MTTVSTMLSSSVWLTMLAIRSGMKPDEILGLGDPTASTVISGAKLDPAKIVDIEQNANLDPLIQAIRQHDFTRATWRSTMPVASGYTGALGTVSLTITNGVVTAASYSGGSATFTGSPPTIEVVDALGSSGYGAQLIPVMAGGTISSITVQVGGRNYASSGVTALINAGYSEGEIYARPVFKWAEMKTIGRIFNRDINAAKRAAQVQGSNYPADIESRMMSLTSDSLSLEVCNQASQITTDLMSGVPTDQDAILYDFPFGLLPTIDDGSNYSEYASVDRTLTANYWWRSKVDNKAHVWGFKDTVEDMAKGKGLIFKGGGPDVLLVSPTLHQKWKSETVAYTQEVNIKDEIEQLGQYGFHLDVIQYGNTYAVADWRMPEGTALGLNTKSFVVAFLKGKKFQPSKLYDQRGIPGGIDGFQFYIETQIIQACIAPPLNVKYTALT